MLEKIKLVLSRTFLAKVKPLWKLIELLLSPSFFRYLTIGFSTFFGQIAIFFLLFDVLKIYNTVSNIIAALIGMVFNFLMSNFWTFKAGSGQKGRKLTRYVILACFNYIFGVLAFDFLANQAHINEYLTQVIVTAVIICWNYFLYRFWVFKKA
jgi:putative flippase GtrA